MTSRVLPLDEEGDDEWGQFVIIDMKEEPISNLCYVTTSLIDLEEGNSKESEYEYIDYYCTIS